MGAFEADVFLVNLSHLLQNGGLTVAHELAELASSAGVRIDQKGHGIIRVGTGKL